MQRRGAAHVGDPLLGPMSPTGRGSLTRHTVHVSGSGGTTSERQNHDTPHGKTDPEVPPVDLGTDHALRVLASYCMSWATRVSAERTDYPPLAARLVGESFELARKVFHTLVQGPTGELKFGHRLSALLSDVPPLERMLRNLWGADLDFVIGPRSLST